MSTCVVAIALLASCSPPPPLSMSPEACNAPPANGVELTRVSENPFQALPTSDGCWVFVSLNGGAREKSHVGVFRRANGKLRLERTVAIEGAPTGMALTNDGTTLVVAAGAYLDFLDVARLESGESGAVLGEMRDPAVSGRVYTNVSPDDKLVFVADEKSASVSVIDLARARASHYDAAASTIGRIPTGALPIALTYSHGGRWMFVTSEIAPDRSGWPIECRPEGARASDALANPPGAIHVVDLNIARTEPARAIVHSIPAGCSPVRLVLSPDGERAYVTARNSNALLVFDVAKLLDDGAHAVIGRVPVGPAPVGIAVTNDGSRVIVTNSNRFAGTRNDRESLTVIDASRVADGAAAVVGSIPAGAFPREMRVTADGGTLILTNFASREIEMVNLGLLPNRASLEKRSP